MTCAHCGEAICGHGDALYQGTVIIDDPDRGGSEPGAYQRHIRDTACMREPVSAAPCRPSGAASHGRARFVPTHLERN